MAKLTANELAQKWSTRLGQAIPDIEKGINSVTVSPTSQAAGKQAKMLANLTKAVNDGKWARGLNSVSLEDWKKAAISKGLPRIGQGATAAIPKMQAFAEKLLPFQASLQSKVNAMPDLTLQDSINKMVAWVNGMSTFKGK